MMNYFSLIFSNNSILRILQKEKIKKIKFNGLCLEFGANSKLERNFLKPFTKKYKTVLSNIDKTNKDFLFLDLEKKTKHKKKYDNIVIFNVLEHLSDVQVPIDNLHFLLKKKGKLFGSTPFLYRIHGAPKDYQRFTKDYLKKILIEKKFKNIEIKELGFGPFSASISLLRGYIKFLPIINHFLICLVLLIDKSLSFFMKTDPKSLYPIGYVFSATKY
jgi:SAM-dependent methyltransferase